MPTEQIYVLETIVHRIELEPSYDVVNRDGLCLNFKFCQKINFDIDTQSFPTPEITEASTGRVIEMNYGKTFLFISRPSDLRQLLSTDPYQLTLYDGNITLGTATIPWKKEFAEMVKFFESLGIVKSTTVEDKFELRNEKGKLTAKIDLFIRMSCFGTNVQTMFHIMKKAGAKQEYLFRQRNFSKVFKVEKHSDERCQPLVAPLYSAITDVKSGPESQINMRENVSLTQLFDRDFMTPKLSSYLGPDDQDGGIPIDFNQDYDQVSMCFRPSENKFFDFLNILSANVKTHEKGTCITLQKNKMGRVESFVKSAGGNLRQSPNLIIEEEEPITEMTADKIAKILCGNKDCPAVKKFKEYGIGPLATGKGLGTLYGEVEPPVTYGMSHTYGTMANYGPYGVFSRPKQEDLPFVPLEPKPVIPCKMRKENPNCSKSSKKNKNKKPEWHSQGCPLCPDRLRGGSDEIMVDIVEEPEPEAHDDGMVMPKSPMIECRSVMNQFDSILAEYKKALGPCGHATCPYAQTMAEVSCKTACENPVLPSPNNASLMSCDHVPCDMDECPYGGEKKIKRYPAGCGSPKCAYTKYKLGLVDADAELELQYLPPPLADSCGDPHCKYPHSPPLPPIHWDCPDPLPKGPCRNLNCPFQPAPLKKFKTQKQLKTGPCGSPMCPYALPQPCGVPTCPFVMRPCPMSEAKDQKQKKKKCPPSSEENICANPDCPFAEENAEKVIPDDVDDPEFKGEFQDCANPDCPFKQKPKKKKSKKKKEDSPCGNPTCPFSKPPKKEKKKKKDKNGGDDISVCSNPECFFNQEKKTETKNRCLQRSSSESVSICSDPECPYADYKKQKKKKKKNGNGSADGESCGKTEEDSICSNPECPERLARQEEDVNICPEPGCPYSQGPPKSSICVDPKCPYLKPLPSCGIPNCPYEPIPVRFSCKNPKCPSHSINFNKKPDRSKFGNDRETKVENNERISQDKTGTNNMAVVLQTTTVCEDRTVCENPDDCENPDCEIGDGDKARPGQQPKKKGKRKKRGKFVYSIGDNYPGTKLGHKECVMPLFNVPPNMGWLWNIFTPVMRLKPRPGWRPGAITRTIAARIRAHRQAKGLGQLKLPNFKMDGTQYQEGDDPKVVPKPTLQIQKKEGTYWITMNPLKDPFSLVENEDPYMDCTPMTFKITKNKKPDDDYCYCDGDAPPENMSSTSSDSELDIEFTPPAGIIHPERFKKRPNVACCEAQYDPKDFEVQKTKDAKKGGKGKDKKGGKGGKGGKKGGKKKK